MTRFAFEQKTANISKSEPKTAKVSSACKDYQEARSNYWLFERENLEVT
jgi:hypothetical protein